MQKPYLGNPTNTIAVLNSYNFSMQKKFGQNFLIDEFVLEKIVRAAEVGPDDYVLEIGPGIGTLTQYLAYYGRQVTAVEIDTKLIPVLADTLHEFPNARVINEDILKVDINRLVQEENDGRPIKVVANLPYYITTPIIMELLEKEVPATNITVMVQKEVAQRMQALPGSKEYGALSLAVQYYADAEITANVPVNCFMPRPKVDSAVITLKLHEKPPVDVKDPKFMFRLIRASFNQRRKTLVNGLNNAPDVNVTKEAIQQALEVMQLSPTVRGETLSLAQFAELANLLKK